MYISLNMQKNAPRLPVNHFTVTKASIEVRIHKL